MTKNKEIWSCSTEDFFEALKTFFESIENLFDKDWERTSANIYKYYGSDFEQDQNFLSSSTFLDPGIDPHKDPWKERMLFLFWYRSLKNLVEENRVVGSSIKVDKILELFNSMQGGKYGLPPVEYPAVSIHAIPGSSCVYEIKRLPDRIRIDTIETENCNFLNSLNSLKGVSVVNLREAYSYILSFSRAFSFEEMIERISVVCCKYYPVTEGGINDKKPQ